MGRNSKARRSKARKSAAKSARYDDIPRAFERETEGARYQREAEQERERREKMHLRAMIRDEPNSKLEIVWNEQKESYYWVWSHPVAEMHGIMIMCQHSVGPVWLSHPLMTIWWSWAKLGVVWSWLCCKLDQFLDLPKAGRFIVAALFLVITRAAIYLGMRV